MGRIQQRIDTTSRASNRVPDSVLKASQDRINKEIAEIKAAGAKPSMLAGDADRILKESL